MRFAAEKLIRIAQRKSQRSVRHQSGSHSEVKRCLNGFESVINLNNQYNVSDIKITRRVNRNELIVETPKFSSNVCLQQNWKIIYFET